MSELKLKYLFNPTQKDARQLKAEFVVRTAIFEQIFTDIQQDMMQKPPQHYMILGQRGMGKTTFLLRLKYAIEDDENLKKWLLPIIFNEEQYAMSDLASFFEHIAQLLAEDHEAYKNLLDEMRKYEFEADYDQKAFDILADYLKTNEQKIIIFHDNFGQFLEKIGKIATHRLRNILMNSPHIRLVGASATLLEHTADYGKPFFDFFYQIRLKGMTAVETILLFEKLAENENKAEDFKVILATEHARIDVMRKLSGGVIRTMVMLFDVFIDNEKSDSFKDLEAILDRVTPLYKHRMDDLKPQQQQIVDAVARAWDAVTVSEIAALSRSERQGLKTNQISAQLKQLVDNQIIEIEPRTTGRTHLYRLQERFFNIWYLMRYSTRQDKQRVIWFTKFLEGWCNTNDLKQLFERFNHNLAEGTYEPNTVFDRALAYAMVENEEVLEEKLQLLSSAINHLENNQYSVGPLDVERETLYFKLLNIRIPIDGNYKTHQIDFGDKYIKFVREGIKERKLEKVSSFSCELLLVGIFCLIYARVEKIEKIFLLATKQQDFSDTNYDFIFSDFFLLLLAKKQYHSAYKLFESKPELKDRLRPIYFLTMEYLKDEYPNEYLKAGEEMRETIEELKARVQWFEEHLT